MYQIETWREGFMVRTRVTQGARAVSLPWVFDCLTHRGAQRKARRHIRHLQRSDNPTRARVQP